MLSRGVSLAAGRQARPERRPRIRTDYLQGQPRSPIKGIRTAGARGEGEKNCRTYLAWLGKSLDPLNQTRLPSRLPALRLAVLALGAASPSLPLLGPYIGTKISGRSLAKRGPYLLPPPASGNLKTGSRGRKAAFGQIVPSAARGSLAPWNRAWGRGDPDEAGPPARPAVLFASPSPLSLNSFAPYNLGHESSSNVCGMRLSCNPVAG